MVTIRTNEVLLDSTLLQFIKARGDDIVAYAWSLKDQVNRAETIEDLDLIDINDGWQNNPHNDLKE